MYQDKYQLTIDKLLTSSVRNNPNQKIVYSGVKTETYASFKENVYRLAKGLVSMGIKKGDRVAVFDYDTMNYLYLYYAVPLSGGVLHTVNIRYPPELIFYTMQHADDKFVIIRDEFVPIIEKSIPLFEFVKGWIVSSDAAEPAKMIEGATKLSDLMKGSANAVLPEIDENDLATTFYTSGTTGMPKGVEFSHRQLVLHSLSSASALADPPISMKSTDVIMPLVPMFHVHSWGTPYFVIMKGMKYVLPGKYNFETIPLVMKNEKVTVSLMVPSVLYMLINSKNSVEIKDLGIRTVIGGGALSKGLYQLAKEHGITANAGYGMSETAPILTLGQYSSDMFKLDENQKLDLSLRAGIPIPLVDLRVVNKEGNDVKNDGKEIGEIIVRSPWLTREYVKDPEGTQKLWKDDWMHTGDLAVIDKYGVVSIVDREKDAVKSGGEFIPTVVIEDAISTYPGVGEVAVVGKPDPKWQERPVAFISGLKELDEKKIREHLMKFVDSGRIAKFWIPDEFRLVESFQKTSTGKIDKKVLREML
ncbi:MAG: long-chain-fatty-acid--CoA ligase [Thermoplasmatales archaeon]|nr:long-chain-fatty-acid--CoA ligase [Thermoplasmatales archaeon]